MGSFFPQILYHMGKASALKPDISVHSGATLPPFLTLSLPPVLSPAFLFKTLKHIHSLS